MNMTSWKKLLLLAGPALLVLAPAPLARAERFDLDRITPVPAGQPIPVADFFRLPLLQNPSVNIAGTHIAATIAAGEDTSILMVYDLKSQKMETLGSRGDTDIVTIAWLNENRLAYLVSYHRLGSYVLGGAKVGALQDSYPILQNISGSVIAVPAGDRTHPLVSIGRGSELTGQYGAVMSVNAEIETGKFLDLSGNGTLIGGQALAETAESNVRHIVARYPILVTPDGFDLGYYADKEGHLAYAISALHGVNTLQQLVGEKWMPCPLDLDEIKMVGSGDRPGEIVVLGPRQEGKPRALEIREAATGKVVEVLVQDKAYDADSWLYRDPTSLLIVGAHYNRAGPHKEWLSKDYYELQKVVDGLFPGQLVDIINTDLAGKIILIRTYSDRQPPIYNWVDLEKHTAGLIKNSAPWIDPKRMLPMSMMKFKTRDGQQLDAYVTMPAGASKQNPPPLVVLPHDWAPGRDNWGYNATVQFLASRGYAVLQPNYRCSSGSTWQFPTADEWAYRKMSEDVAEATKTLVRSGLVDAGRVAIMGTNFGGYLALAGAAFEPDLYHCAVAVSPVVDWGRLIEDNRVNRHQGDYFDYMVRKMGDPRKDEQKFADLSPLQHAGQIRAPLFISTSEYDNSAQTRDTKSLVSKVESNHVPVTTVSYVNESGGVRHLDNKVDLNTRIEEFLAKNLMPRTP
jgi:dienelactone hydrolase